MNFLRTVLADLRERQILPAVVLLAVLAVGIPLGASKVLGKVTTPPPVSLVQPPVTVPKGLPAPTQEMVVLNATTVPATTRHGAEPNPFREGAASTSGSAPSSPVSTPVKTTPVKTTPANTTPARTTPAKVTPARTTPAKTTPKTVTPKKVTPKKVTPKKPAPKKVTPAKPAPKKVTPAKPAPKTTKPNSGGSAPVVVTPTSGPVTLSATQAYAVNIDTKDATGTHALTNVIRLAPLPAAQTPEVIYLGVLKNGRKAAFLFTNSVKVSSGQSAKGVTCLPSPSDCQIAELSPGQGMKLAATSNTALIATFTFELMSISANKYSSAAAALQARDNVSTAGQSLLQLSTSNALTTVRFDNQVGALVQVRSGGSTGATGSSGTSGSTGATGTGG
jgi:hypothetical protein